MDNQEIERIWAKYDTKGLGYIEASGVKSLMQDLVETQLTGLRKRAEELAKLSSAVEPAVNHLYQTLDLDRDGDLKRAEFLAKIIEGYELPLEPAAKKRKIGWAIGQNFEIDSEELAQAKAKHIQILDAATIDSMSKAIEALIRGIISASEGFCVVYSSSKKKHFVLFRDDKKRDALEAFGRLQPKRQEVWATQNTFILCADDVHPKVEDKAKMLEDVQSVSMAIDGLTMGLLKCDDICCVVHSVNQKAYYVVYRSGQKEAALERFGKASV